MQKVKVAGTIREAVPLVRVAGVWKDIEQAWVNVQGVWKVWKPPYVAKGGQVTLASTMNGSVERRSFTRSGQGSAVGTPGPAVNGSISMPSVVVNGVTYEIRGIESGSDPVAGTGTEWRWVSFQFFGNVDPALLARDGMLNGKRCIYVGTGGGYIPANDHTYLTYLMDTAFQFPVGQALDFKF